MAEEEQAVAEAERALAAPRRRTPVLVVDDECPFEGPDGSVDTVHRSVFCRDPT
ncbi:MAG: hypothetical protein ACR2HP_12985 [Ilumatobacteraceae bacterium]